MAAGGASFSKKSSAYPNLVTDAEKCTRFLQEFTSDYATGEKKYLDQLQRIANREQQTLDIDIDDIKQWADGEFQSSVLHNTSRYVNLFYRAADALMPQSTRPFASDDFNPSDIYQQHRQQRIEAALQEQQAAAGAAPAGAPQPDVRDMFPPELMRRYEIRLTPSASSKPTQLRQIKAKDVGSYVSVRGIVTRVTDVAPQVRVVCYICSVCGYESYQPVNDKDFTPLKVCPSPACTRNEHAGKLLLQTRGSKFVRFQSVRLQEMHTEVPVGHIPRTTTLRIYGSLTRVMKPGDLVTVSGVYLVAPYGGFRAIRAGLTTDTYIEAMHVVPSKKSYALAQAELDETTAQQIEDKSREANVYHQLAASIAPEIYGHVDIKRALMLLLVGGVTRKLSDGLKIRGDINVLLMGDPGVAKSQLLKHIAHIAPRGIYTTGKGSSGVGLTAAVLRDPTTGDMSLEGGSLVLADMGICCIDEFDKMEEGDRTAIHEVMEQQTVSIAKAGITTTLNARAAVLAAANPVWGRWRPKASPEANLGLPASLLSRFDLTWIILDKPDAEMDMALARHVTHVHIHSSHPASDAASEPLDPAFLRAYIAKARTFSPFVPKDLTEYIVQSYVTLRKDGDEGSLDSLQYGKQSVHANTRQRFCTARMLLSILRLSQALARLHFRNQVERDDVEEAMRLVSSSRDSHLDDGDKAHARADPVSACYQLVQQMAQETGRPNVSIMQAKNRAIKKGYSEADWQATLDQYAELSVWVVGQRDIKFVSAEFLRE